MSNLGSKKTGIKNKIIGLHQNGEEITKIATWKTFF